MPNRLINEKSPYLRQHAHNPVDWYPWGDEAFRKARSEDKPIFLSIGYSTCYWCHVMEREVFENEDIAREMNRIFVNIKLDREERPDIDRIYMSALQSMTGSGGWPMSMFLNTDLKPFYGATYLPPYSKYGMPGFLDLILSIEKSWKTRRDDINITGDEIMKHISEAISNKTTDVKFSDKVLKSAIERFKDAFDEEYGGFGSAPKFPRPAGINFLLNAYYRFNDKDCLQMAIRTLLQMARGGIYDHIGGGFHRYSVDRYWHVPHFEKMLYDQAQIADNYIDLYLITKDKYFETIARETLDYVIRVFSGSEGGFYSAEDAESEINNSSRTKKEGAFYTWTKSELDDVLGEFSDLFCYYYGVKPDGNVKSSSDPHGVFISQNILYTAHSLSETANKFSLSTDKAFDILTECKQKIFNQRERRPKPFLDDKILTSWNSLAISSLANAYRAFGEIKYLEHAVKAADFILKHLYDETANILYHRYRDCEVKIEGMLEDYAFTVKAFIDLFLSSQDYKYIKSAEKFAERLVSDFYDETDGGFFDSSARDKTLPIRTKEDYDSAEPSGNSVAINELIRLSYLTGKQAYYDIAYQSLKAFGHKLVNYPYAMPQKLIALDRILSGVKQVVITGNDARSDEMIKELFSLYLPDCIYIRLKPEDMSNPFSTIIENRQISSAYICENFKCKLPVYSSDELRKELIH
jgi:uncharacterized protein YyaL (SSP411 family)